MDLTDQRFERLIAKSPSHQNKNGGWFWNCECDCGNKTIVSVGKLRNGTTKSCGCFNLDRITKHGLCHTPEYKIWQAMVQRCSNVKYKMYKHYGGRGIKVCKRWLEFENFFADMGERPNNKLTIERVNNDKGYSPSNCIWDSWLSQGHNKRLNKRNKSGHAGVFWNKRLKKWAARIMADYKSINLGWFNDISDAISAREAGELEYWGKL